MTTTHELWEKWVADAANNSGLSIDEIKCRLASGESSLLISAQVKTQETHTMNKAKQAKADDVTPLRALSDYLDKSNDLFDETGLTLLQEGIYEIEGRGIAAIIVAGKTVLQYKIGREITTDIFKQGLDIIRMSNRLLSLMTSYKVAEKVEQYDMVLAMRSLIAGRMFKLIDHDTAICTLIGSVLHILKDDSDKGVDFVMTNPDDDIFKDMI